MSLSTGDKRQMLREMIDFIKDNEIIHLVDFTNYCLSDNAPAGWFEILTERNTLFLKEYIKSNWQKYKSGEEMKKTEKISQTIAKRSDCHFEK